MTRFAVFPISALFLLSACSNGLYYRQGASFVTMDRDLTTCQVSALQSAPVANQTRFTPRKLAEKEVCDSRGACHIDYVWTGGEPYQVDVNTDLRNKVESQCMADKGYAWIELPNCPDATPFQSLNAAMPALTEASCVAHGSAGRWQVVTPG